MNIDEKLEKIQEGTLEIVDIEELKAKLEKEHPVAYTGYEPSGKVHLGHAITIMKLKQLQSLGFKPQNTIKNASKLWGSLKIPNTYSVLNSRLKEDTLSNTPTMFTSWLL